MAGSWLHVADWLPIIEKLMKRLDGWKGSAMSLGGRLTLINSCLSNLPIYTMSMYWLPVSTLDKMDTTRKKILLARGRLEEEISPCQVD